jgi:signal transduction histidine kinase
MNRFLTKVYLLVGGVLLTIIVLGVLLNRSSRSFAYTHLRVDHGTRQLEAVHEVSEAFQRHRQMVSWAGHEHGERLVSNQVLRDAVARLRSATLSEAQMIDPELEGGSQSEEARLVRVEALVARLGAQRFGPGDPPPVGLIRELERELTRWEEDERRERDEAVAAASSLHAQVAPVARLSSMLAFLLVAVAVFLVVPRFHRSLSDLLAGCARLAQGDLATRIPEKGDAEFAALAVAFNRMASDLQEFLRREVAATERAARVEAQSQTSKMTAIGQLASGVAHEINNPLGVILGFAQGMERRVKPEDPLHLPVRSIVREALRCKGLVQELLTFARAAKKTVEPVQLNALVRDSSVLLESRAKTQAVRVEHELSSDAPVVVANQSQLQQIIVNLGTNALDAMGAGGTLTLRTRAAGAAACLEVADTGSGIPPEIRDRIFDPFFTTKDPGKGTGLGLSLVHEIVQQHGGSIRVESQTGKGTTMSVVLPARPA